MKLKHLEKFMGVSPEPTKWDWLMSVAEKIEKLEVKQELEDKREVTYFFNVDIWGLQCTISRDMLPQYYGTETDFLKLYDCRNKNKMKSVQKAITKFIDWYNKTNI